MKKLFTLFTIFLTALSSNAQITQNNLFGDLNKDGKVTVSDVMMLVNIVMNGQKNLSLNAENVSVTIDKSYTVTIISGYGKYTAVSSDESIAEVSLEGSTITITGKAAGTVVVTVTDQITDSCMEINVTVTEDIIPYLACPDDHHPHMIDLGLPSGTKWACCNVDTDHPENQSPTNYGGYYAWGETETKSTYKWSTYIHCNGTDDTCHDLGSDIAGTQYDVAHVKWGDSWQMPTRDQISELLNNTTFTWTSKNDVIGIQFTSVNGGSIFMPAAGYRNDSALGNKGLNGNYWSSSQLPSNLSIAYDLDFGSGSAYIYDDGFRNFGQSVRPVVSSSIVANLHISSATLSIFVGDVESVEITSGSGSYAVESSDESVATATIQNNIITVGAVTAGTATITVTDTQSSQTATISVTVSGNLVINGNCESDNVTCLWGRDGGVYNFENGVYTHFVEDGGFNGSRGIRVQSLANAQNDYDTQFFVYTPNHVWKEGEKYRFKMKYRAEKTANANINAYKDPTSYLCYRTLTGNIVFQTEWQEYEYEGTITSEENGMQTIGFMLNVSKEANNYYFDDIYWEFLGPYILFSSNNVYLTLGEETTVEITSGNGSYTVSSSNEDIATAVIDGNSVKITAISEGDAVITVTDVFTGKTNCIKVTARTSFDSLVVNGDCESNDVSCLRSNDRANMLFMEDVGVNGSRCIRVQSIDNAQYDWETQFFVYTPNHVWKTGEHYRFKMMYRADKPATISTQSHGKPGEYLHFEMFGNLQAELDWQEFEFEGEISSEQDGMQTITFLLNVSKEANNYYFDDISWVLMDTEIPLAPLQLSQNSITTIEGENTSVIITSGNGNYRVSSSDENVVTVMIDGSSVIIAAVGDGTATITVTDTQTGQTANISVTVAASSVSLCPDDHHPHMIDLGLPSGTLWACCNVDTEHPENQKPENDGGYYAWGDTEEKSVYDWDNYGYDFIGNDPIIRTMFDVAHVKWGGAWQMPTYDHFEELLNKCTHQWTTLNGIEGFKFSGSNGVGIFLPAAGGISGYNYFDFRQGCIYWSGTLSNEWGEGVEPDVTDAKCLYLRNGDPPLPILRRSEGLSVRPVITRDAPLD